MDATTRRPRVQRIARRRALKRALVTGGTRGIGSAIVTALIADGFDVMATGTSPDARVAPGCRYLPCDFTDPASLEAFASKLATDELSVLVNNAGINKVSPLVDYEPGDFERIQQVNVIAPFQLCRAVVPGMRKRRYGRIVNIKSIYGLVSREGRSAYSASKFGLFGLSRALALEVARDNILVNCVAPGIVETDLTRQVLGVAGMAEIVTRIPAGRLAQPEEIARYVRFLVSEDNTYLTGQQIVVDGGYTCA